MPFALRWASPWGLLVFIGCLSPFITAPIAAAEPSAGPRVSYFRDVLPIFRAHCQGCHQPGKASGEYQMTEFDSLLRGGESGAAAVVPGKPETSALLEKIRPTNGVSEMPKDKPPLSAEEINNIERWILQGAEDDSPQGAHVDAAHPPVYQAAPCIPSLDYSPNGELLAVAAWHEVLLLDAASGEIQARLVGNSERIESIRFSPDGSRLAACGGNPAEFGEVQIWNVSERRQELSLPAGHNTVYGLCWSPDGKRISYGCGAADDNSVRIVEADSGKQVLYQGAHSDWVRDTAFSVDGSHVISVGRDMTVKLTEVATQRFVDNITSITPGALKGGIQAVSRHPRWDQLVVAGADGLPSIYRVFRESARQIGDDANLVFGLYPLKGRVFSARFNTDGKRVVYGGGVDGTGEVAAVNYDYNEDVPASIKAIMGKVPGQRTPEEHAAMTAYKEQGTRLLWRASTSSTPIYAIAIDPRTGNVAAAGRDGVIRILSAADGTLISEWAPSIFAAATAGIESSPQPNENQTVAARWLRSSKEVHSEEQGLPNDWQSQVVKLDVAPSQIEFHDPSDYVQLLITATLTTGEVLDVTRVASLAPPPDLVMLQPSGLLQPLNDGTGALRVAAGSAVVNVPIHCVGVHQPHPREFVRHIAPVLSKLGCNAGTCHGSAQGKLGFKLSLRGYDPLLDVRALTDDLAGRRTNLAAPEASLFLEKAAARVPHAGGQLVREGDAHYQLLFEWIKGGAKLDAQAVRVQSIAITSIDPIVERPGQRRQFRVMAAHTDGSESDVTQEAFFESGNTEVAVVNATGLATAIRRGEAAIMARYEGAYASTTLTVMGNREGFEWKQPESWGPIDDLVAKKWERVKLLPSELTSDAEFVRRIYLDLTGLPPDANVVRSFLADERPTRAKRDELIDRLLESPAYVVHCSNKWADLLQVNRKFLGQEGAKEFRKWINAQIAANIPYDAFARSLLTSQGSNRTNPPSAYYKILREPSAIMENTTHLFLGVRFNCNKCHDHPFERWTQDQYYQLSAYFAHVGLEKDPESGDRSIGGTDVESPKPLYESVVDRSSGDVLHARTALPALPGVPFGSVPAQPEGTSRRAQLAAWITAPENDYFARSYVNRQWGYLLGRGIMDPIDDLRAANPPSNPELLNYLTQEFVRSGFNMRELTRLIVKSRTYQLSVAVNRWNEDDAINYSHAMARRLPAETLYDAIHAVTGANSQLPEVPAGTRAAELPDSGIELPSGFFSTFGRPVRESACECERSNDLLLGPVIALVSGPTLAQAIADPGNQLPKMVDGLKDDRQLSEELILRVLNRPPLPGEVERIQELRDQMLQDHQHILLATAERESQIASVQAIKASERLQSIAIAKQTLSDYEQQYLPLRKAQEDQQKADIERLAQELDAYRKQLPELQQRWEVELLSEPVWETVVPKILEMPAGVTAAVLSDRSVLANGNGNGQYALELRPNSTQVASLRLEVLPDPSLPMQGVGLNSDGNFVLNQLELFIRPDVGSSDLKPLPLDQAIADFSQQGFPIGKVIDGQPNDSQGWAVSPLVAQTHWAALKLKTPITLQTKESLIVRMTHRYQNTFALGRFRLAVGSSAQPLRLGVSEELLAIASTPVANRGASQQQQLTQFFTDHDETLASKAQALNQARSPLPQDARLLELQAQLEKAMLPVSEDPVLRQLREELELSRRQLDNSRLTAAQDLVWALINSPAFLFNR